MVHPLSFCLPRTGARGTVACASTYLLHPSSFIVMDLLARVTDGFQSIPADNALKERALQHLRQWLTEIAFACYLPQLEWLVRTQQWPGLLDRFYQIMPFGTGGRR